MQFLFIYHQHLKEVDEKEGSESDALRDPPLLLACGLEMNYVLNLYFS